MARAIQDKTGSNMRPELELVFCLARAKSSDNEDRIHTLLSKGVDWSEFAACAVQHNLGGLIQERILTLGPDWLPSDQREKLGALACDLTKNNLMYTGQMLMLYGLFEAAQIPVIPFKGPALAWLAYPNFAHRTCVDLDFVVPQRYIPEAKSLLQAHGYTPQFSHMETHEGQHGPVPGQYAFASSDTHIFVELHTDRTLRYFSPPLNVDEMNSRLIRLEIGGRTIRTFSVEDLLVMLCVHGAKHFWGQLGWIVDIAQLVKAREVHWSLLAQIAAQRKSTRLLWLGFYLADEVIGAPLPQCVLQQVQRDNQVRWLAGKVLEQYSRSSDLGYGIWRRAAFRLRSCDNYWQGLRQLLRLSMSPTESDREVIQLPVFLLPLYRILRPLRLLGEYGLGWRRRPKPDLAVYVPPLPRS